ncbi:hypothetical protein [Larkinella sp.]|uniref:hypothetical protein n=1 Tax=Larkinella sp. TaxID=2034517 RepID=UPI003BACCB5C
MNDHNLKPAKPGEVRNPNGKPKGTRNRSTIARRVLGLLVKDGLPDVTINALRSMYGDKVDEMTLEEAVTLVQVGDAIAGKRRAIAYKVVLDSAYGLPKQQLEHTGEDGGAILIDDVSRLSTDELKRRLSELKKGRDE